MANRELMQEIKRLEQTLPSGVNYTKIDDCKIEERWECPIGLDLMVEPVIASDGATYDKKNFEEYIATRTAAKQSLLSPTTGLVLPAGALYFPANNISSEINTLLETKLTELKKLLAAVKESENIPILRSSASSSNHNTPFVSPSSSSSAPVLSTNPQPSAPSISLYPDLRAPIASYSNSSTAPLAPQPSAPPRELLLEPMIPASSSSTNPFSQRSRTTLAPLAAVQPSAPPHALLDDKEQQHPEAWYARAQDENTNPVEARRLYALIMEEGKKGDAAAQYFLYHMYGSGHGVLRDSSVAYNYLTRSAEKRYFPAQNALARMNEKLALNSSFVASQSSFFNQSKQSSSIKKDPATLYSEGCKHRDTGDFSSAQRCLEEAAKQKSPEACYALAQMYEDEKIWVQNSNDRPLYIQHWYTQAASFGHTDAAYRMGQIHDKEQYRYGNITIDGRVIYFAPVNMNTSHKWYLRAGATHAGAQYKLGLYYEERYNRGSAYSCYQRALAANKGHHAAADALIQLSAEVQVELDSYVSQKDLANKSALWGPSEDDVARVTLAIALRGKLSGQERARMFSKKEVELIFSSDRLNAILNKPQHSWIIDKLRGEWAEEPQAQNAPRMGMSNGR